MRRSWLFIFGFLLLTAGTADAKFKFKGSIGLRGGYYALSGGDQYWDTLKEDFKNTYQDFSSFNYGVDVAIPVTDFLDFVVGADYYRSNVDVDSDVLYDINGDGKEIVRDFTNTVTLELLPIHVIGLRYHPLRSRSPKVSPFIGVQASVLLWRYKEEGTFVYLDIFALDNDSGSGRSEVPDYILLKDDTTYSNVDLAVNLQVGCEFYVHKHVTLSVMARYMMADDQLNRRFKVLNVKRLSREPYIQDVQLRSINNFDRLNLDNFDVGFQIAYKF